MAPLRGLDPPEEVEGDELRVDGGAGTEDSGTYESWPDSGLEIDAGCGMQTLYLDRDGDGHISRSGTLTCTPPREHWEATPGEDCDDENSRVAPDEEEICDGLDNNCDGEVDEGARCRGLYCFRFLFDGGTYQFCNEIVERPTAADRCESFGYQLVTINSAEEQAFIDHRLSSTFAGSFWIGLQGEDESSFRWDDGTSMDYANWSDAEPSEGNCARVHRHEAWATSPCDGLARYICEVR